MRDVTNFIDPGAIGKLRNDQSKTRGTKRRVSLKQSSAGKKLKKGTRLLIDPIRMEIKQRIIDDRRKKETEKRAHATKRNEGKQGVQEGNKLQEERMEALKKEFMGATVESFRKSIGRYLTGTEDIEWAKKIIQSKMKT